MRKNREQQKNEMVRQLNLFEDQIKPANSHDGRTGLGTRSGVELLLQLERQRTLTENLLEAVVDYGNLRNAYQRVRQNKGSAGIDEMDVETLGEWLNKRLNTFRAAVLAKEYQPSAVRKVMISKPGGGERMLGIPTVKDRMLQQAVHQILSRYYDPLFSENSFGFRPGRNAHQAISQASKYIRSGKEWVVDIDLEKFFDNVNHDRLMQRLSKGIGDKRLLRLIKSYLKSGIMSGGLTEQRIAGTPQGSPLSPLLSNIVLDEWDKEMEKRGHDFCRYADDCNIYVKSKKAGERVQLNGEIS
jgi:RNA-directed DNA polymerase